MGGLCGWTNNRFERLFFIVVIVIIVDISILITYGEWNHVERSSNATRISMVLIVGGGINFLIVGGNYFGRSGQ